MPHLQRSFMASVCWWWLHYSIDLEVLRCFCTLWLQFVQAAITVSGLLDIEAFTVLRSGCISHQWPKSTFHTDLFVRLYAHLYVPEFILSDHNCRQNKRETDKTNSLKVVYTECWSFFIFLSLPLLTSAHCKVNQLVSSSMEQDFKS